MHKGFNSLGDIIKEEPGLSSVRKVLHESDVVIDFHKVFPDLEKIAKAVKVDKKVLFLRVDNSVWRSELKFKENLIIENVNKFYKEERIKWVKFIS